MFVWSLADASLSSGRRAVSSQFSDYDCTADTDNSAAGYTVGVGAPWAHTHTQGRLRNKFLRAASAADCPGSILWCTYSGSQLLANREISQ